MINCILVRYGELHLKGLNRPYFERKLHDALTLAASGGRVYKTQGRFIVRGFDEGLADAIMGRIARVFGIVSLSPAVECEKDFEVITSVAEKLLRKKAGADGTFKVRARRSDKQFPMSSDGICRELGARLIATTGLRVDVHNPDVYVDVEIRESAYVYTDTIPAAGGMPAGTAGRALVLLSGGIDSPVAAYMTAKRGAAIDCVYFHSFPYTGERAKQKVIDLCRKLSEYGVEIALHVVSFTDIQTLLLEKCREDYITVLMRRMMMRIANIIAEKVGAGALVTGESLGQVASQTMQSIGVVDMLAQIPVFRPLIGFDKIDIMNLARKIGTYDISVLPYEDCCSVFVPKHPVTRPEARVAEAEEAKLEFEPLVQAAADNAEMVRFFGGDII